MAIRRHVKARRRRIAAVVGVTIALFSAGATALTVFDPNNFVENQITRMKVVEELNYVINSFNELKSFTNWRGNVTDMALGAMPTALKTANELTNCINVVSNQGSSQGSNNLCAKQRDVANEYFATPTGNGEVGDPVVAQVRAKRATGLADAVRRGVAIGRYHRGDAGASQEIADLAQLVESPVSGSAQTNVTNRLLMELVRQVRIANTIAAAHLELDGNLASTQVDIVVGSFNGRTGIAP